MRWIAGFAVCVACLGVACSGSSDAPETSDGSVDDTRVNDAAEDALVTADADGSETPSDAAMPDAPEAGGCSAPATYDELVLCDRPVGYWAMHRAGATEADLTGKGSTGTYVGGVPASATMPNGDVAADFDGATQSLTIPSNAAFSIPTTHTLTWEGWIRPDTLQFPKDSSDGYVDWMGKCDHYAPTCEWEARMYDTTNPQGRCNRLSAYVFNPSAGLGSAADWQPTCGSFMANQWHHVVGRYTTLKAPADCTGTGMYPGSIDIWVDGVQWNHASHGQTGCMSQYKVVPVANESTVQVGSMASDTWFKGAIGKVAIYDHELTTAQIAAHFKAMTGKTPTGSCADTCSL